MKKTKFLISALVLMFILCLNTNVQAKYAYSEIETAIKFNVEKYVPVVSMEVKEITNTNTGYEQYANSTHEIDIHYEVKTKSRIVEHIENQDIIIKLDGKAIENYTIDSFVTTHNDTTCTYQYRLKLKNIEGNGKLSFEIVDGAIRTYNNLFSTSNEIETNIIIDNIKPSTVVKEEKIENGKVMVTVTSNECIRTREEWSSLDNQTSISKEFPSNISYIVDIIDFAGNVNKTEINVTLATFINLTYGSYNSNFGWSYINGNGDIAGKEASIADTKNKIESLVYRLDGNVEADFVQARIYVYSYWQNTLGYCNVTNLTYTYGFNPSKSGWKNMLDDELAMIEGKEYVQFGGVGINSNGQTNIYGEQPIPSHIASMYPYGISAISFKLKDYTDYSIIYQPYHSNHGWLAPKYNEEEASMGYSSIISAFRIAIIPNSELQDVYSLWNEVVGNKEL